MDEWFLEHEVGRSVELHDEWPRSGGFQMRGTRGLREVARIRFPASELGNKARVELHVIGRPSARTDEMIHGRYLWPVTSHGMIPGL